MEVKDNITVISDRLFRKFGIRGVTVDDICSEGGISKKTVYMYFKDKHSIAKNAIDFYNNNLYNQIKIVIKNSSNSIDALIGISKKFRETLYDTTPLFIHDLKKYHPDLYKMTQDYKEQLFYKTLQNIINTGKEEGLIRVNINEEITSKLRVEMIESGFNQDVFPLKKFDFREIQNISFDLFIRGIVTKSGLSMYEDIIKNIHD
ncbi:MAG: hypothetical protein CNE34_02755 [Rhodothermaeota bacterium MED-G18]|nr:MAG: hypothetical protein CNE34_02755 [Rhodothermaeota bacterium MED-G18]|tara:strand:- start:949 stop:1560 length:612 start_codon:yes stop_codon:yes gene_type:complete